MIWVSQSLLLHPGSFELGHSLRRLLRRRGRVGRHLLLPPLQDGGQRRGSDGQVGDCGGHRVLLHHRAWKRLRWRNHWVRRHDDSASKNRHVCSHGWFPCYLLLKETILFRHWGWRGWNKIMDFSQSWEVKSLIIQQCSSSISKAFIKIAASWSCFKKSRPPPPSLKSLF